MGSVRAPPDHALCEPIPAPTIFVSGIGEIARIGGNCACFVLYQSLPDLDPDSPAVERQVVARVIVPLDAIPTAVRQALAFIDEDMRLVPTMMS